MSLKAAVAMPSACAAMLGRERLSAVSKILMPSPGAPKRLARGTRHLSKATAAVGEARWPILSSMRVVEKPGVPFSTTSAEIAPLASAISDHLPNNSIRSQTLPLVMKVLPPSTMISSPAGVNLVVMPVASEPALGSVMAMEPMPPAAMRGNSRFFCSSLPNKISGQAVHVGRIDHAGRAAGFRNGPHHREVELVAGQAAAIGLGHE